MLLISFSTFAQVDPFVSMEKCGKFVSLAFEQELACNLELKAINEASTPPEKREALIKASDCQIKLVNLCLGSF